MVYLSTEAAVFSGFSVFQGFGVCQQVALLTSAQRQVRTGMEFEQFVHFVHSSSDSPIRVATDDDWSQHRDLLLDHGYGSEAFVSASIFVSLAGKGGAEKKSSDTILQKL